MLPPLYPHRSQPIHLPLLPPLPAPLPTVEVPPLRLAPPPLLLRILRLFPSPLLHPIRLLRLPPLLPRRARLLLVVPPRASQKVMVQVTRPLSLSKYSSPHPALVQGQKKWPSLLRDDFNNSIMKETSDKSCGGNTPRWMASKTCRMNLVHRAISQANPSPQIWRWRFLWFWKLQHQHRRLRVLLPHHSPSRRLPESIRCWTWSRCWPGLWHLLEPGTRDGQQWQPSCRGPNHDCAGQQSVPHCWKSVVLANLTGED